MHLEDPNSGSRTLILRCQKKVLTPKAQFGSFYFCAAEKNGSDGLFLHPSHATTYKK